jgi:hypothetical protein
VLLHLGGSAIHLLAKPRSRIGGFIEKLEETMRQSQLELLVGGQLLPDSLVVYLPQP